MAKTHVTMKVNGAEVEGLVEPRTLLVHFIRENLSLTGTHIGCETTHCGACTVDIDGMSVKSCTMFAVQAAGLRHHDHRGRRQCRRLAVGAAGRLSDDARPAMRLLHARHDFARAAAAARKIRRRPRKKSGWAFPAISAAAPATRTSSRRSSTPPPRSMALNSRRLRNERHDSHAGTTRSQTRRHGLQAQAGRGHPLHARQGQLRRRPETAGHAARRFRPLAACACARQEDRRHRGAEGAGRARGHHRRDAEDRQPRLDADARRRRADGAGRRQGAVPEPGGRLRGRRPTAMRPTTASTRSWSNTSRCRS